MAHKNIRSLSYRKEFEPNLFEQISEKTLQGEHLTEFKKRQIEQQNLQEKTPEDAQLKPMGAP